MKRTKLFLLASALIMLTAGAFATGSKLFTDNTPPNLYYSPSAGSYVQIVNATLQTAPGLVYHPSVSTTAATISGSHTYDLYTYGGTPAQFYQVFSTTF